MALIEARKLNKNFGPIRAVQDVSFTVDKGEVLGFLGPNGAGKSTVMRMLTGFLTPTSGTALIGDHDVHDDSMAARRMIGYLPESNPLYSEMTVHSFLDFIADMRGYAGAEKVERVSRSIEMCWLESARHQALDTLSKGFKRRVGLAQALLHDPPVLVLDEPTDGLDPNQKYEVRNLVNRMAKEKAIIVSTHILEEVDAVCTRALIIAKGKLVADGTPEELRRRAPRYGAVRLSVRGDAQGVSKEALQAVEGVASVDREGEEGGVTRFLVTPRNGKTILPAVLEAARSRNWTVENAEVETGRLDDVFREITMKESKRP